MHIAYVSAIIIIVVIKCTLYTHSTNAVTFGVILSLRYSVILLLTLIQCKDVLVFIFDGSHD